MDCALDRGVVDVIDRAEGFRISYWRVPFTLRLVFKLLIDSYAIISYLLIDAFVHHSGTSCGSMITLNGCCYLLSLCSIENLRKIITVVNYLIRFSFEFIFKIGPYLSRFVRISGLSTIEQCALNVTNTIDCIHILTGLCNFDLGVDSSSILTIGIRHQVSIFIV